MQYLELKDSKYTKLRKSLIKEKGSKIQKEFLNVLKENKNFLQWIDSKVGLDNTNGQLFDKVSEPLSEHEFKEMPKKVEADLFASWSDIAPAQASQETFWGYVTLQNIRVGVIDAYYLAANGGALPGGLERIDTALRDNSSKCIDSIVRTALRRLSGLPEARGRRSVYVDCPFSRAWWRGYVVNQVHNETSAEPEKVIKALRSSRGYWEQLISMVVSRNSSMGDTKVRAALIWALSEWVDDKDRGDLYKVNALQDIVRKISIRSAWQELAVFDVKQLKDIISKEFPTKPEATSADNTT